MDSTPATTDQPEVVCGHDSPKTYYATQGATQHSSPHPGSLAITSGAILAIFHGALCDKCARARGLSPTAFGRELDGAS